MQLNKRIMLLLAVVAMFAIAPVAMAAEAEAAGPLDALGINGGFMFSQFVNFLLVFGLLTFGLWNRVTNMLDARAAKIQKGLEDAAAAASARRNAEAEAEKVLANARQEANTVVEQGRTRGEEAAKTVQTDARTNADKIRADARIEAAAIRDAELASLRGQVANIGVAIARRLIGESLIDENKQKALIADFFTNVPADAKNLSGKVEVVSAMPLDDAEQGKVKSQLSASDVTFSVDPGILGGLVIRAGERVIDGSVRSSLGSLTGRLN